MRFEYLNEYADPSVIFSINSLYVCKLVTACYSFISEWVIICFFQISHWCSVNSNGWIVSWENCSCLCRPSLEGELPDPTDSFVHTIKNVTIVTWHFWLGILCFLGNTNSVLSPPNNRWLSLLYKASTS